MLKDNLIVLRNTYGYSQEKVAEKIGISRQAYAKWEMGVTIPSLEKCKLLATLYGVTIDSLIREEEVDGLMIPPAPKGKEIWGSVTISERGQIVIPKEVREKFGLSGGQRLIVLSDENGIALVESDKFFQNMKRAMDEIKNKVDKDN